MTEITMTARALMVAADRLTGAEPAMSPEALRARMDAMTPERQMAVYLCDSIKKTRDSAERAEIRTRMEVLVGKFPFLKNYINQQVTGIVSVTRQPIAGRPKSGASEATRRREASRAYRERRKAVPES